MPKKGTPQPTPAELRILQVLWDDGPSTVRAVHGVLSEVRRTGYTTVLKLLQIMTEKGLVTRNTSERSHVYKAKYTEQRTQRALVGDMVERVFHGSAAGLVVQALSNRKASAKELEAIRALLDDARERNRESGK